MPKRIVYTRPDGGVSVCAPSLTALRFMTGGGGRSDGYPRGFLDRQIAKQSEECGALRHGHAVRRMHGRRSLRADAGSVLRAPWLWHLAGRISARIEGSGRYRTKASRAVERVLSAG